MHQTPVRLKQVLLLFILFLPVQALLAQNTFKAIVESDEEAPEILPGATAVIIGTQISAVADTTGMVILYNVPNGDQTIEFSYIGYFKARFRISFPQAHNAAITQVRLPVKSQRR